MISYSRSAAAEAETVASEGGMVTVAEAMEKGVGVRGEDVTVHTDQRSRVGFVFNMYTMKLVNRSNPILGQPSTISTTDRMCSM